MMTLVYLKALRQMEVLIQEAKAHDKLQQDQLELINKHKVYCQIHSPAYNLSSSTAHLITNVALYCCSIFLHSRATKLERVCCGCVCIPQEVNKELEMLLQAERIRLARKQESEMQSKHVAEKLEVEKRMIGKDDEEHKKKIEELKDELTSIQEDFKLQNSVVNVLSSTNMNELQEAKKTAVSVRQQEQDQVLLWYESYAFLQSV